MALKTCKVSCVDLRGVEHAIEVSAGSGQTSISVKVKHPEIEHTVRVQDFERWLEAGPRSPAEMILKNHLRELLTKGR